MKWVINMNNMKNRILQILVGLLGISLVGIVITSLIKIGAPLVNHPDPTFLQIFLLFMLFIGALVMNVAIVITTLNVIDNLEYSTKV